MNNARGFTLIEIILVLGLIAFVYIVAIPQFTMRSGLEASSKLTRLQQDFRAAYDLAILSQRTYRLVFDLDDSKYHLEEADQRDAAMPQEPVQNDPSPETEKQELEAFEQQFKEFEDAAGDPIPVGEKDEKIRPTSPVLKAEGRLAPPKWKKVESLEWGDRDMGDFLVIFEAQGEHHANKQVLSELPEKARLFLYAFPNGKIEKAFLRIGYRKNGREIDETQVPYLLRVNPTNGTSELTSTSETFQFEKDDDADEI